MFARKKKDTRAEELDDALEAGEEYFKKLLQQRKKAPSSDKMACIRDDKHLHKTKMMFKVLQEEHLEELESQELPTKVNGSKKLVS